MADLQVRLQAAVGDGYRIEKELGGGGMSRLFLATETSLHRQVVIKLLPPEFASEVSAARFKQEIELAAQLQHPNILPVLTAGAKDDLLFYVMPFVSGESLRHRLTREGKLPVADAVRILQEIADALAHAHAEGVIHRDIKPENILLEGRHAVLTDFGVARALAESRSGGRLTETGISVGTPAYMSPEQAAGERHVDARADVYALAVVGYEMLAGFPPFAGPTPQAVIAAHLTATPRPLLDVQPETPPDVADAIARALSKNPNTRPQTAAEFRDTIGTLAAGPARWQANPLRVAGLYGLVAVAVLGLAYFLTTALGLPSWVVSGAAVLLLVGLPIIVVTGLVERRRAIARTTAAALAASRGLQGWFTWRKALAGGALAFGALTLGAAGYMAMRLLGIGPVGTLVASGVLKEREPILLADFVNRTADSTLGPTLTVAFRVDLSQSLTIQLLDVQAVRDALRRMLRPPGVSLDLGLAREVAEREGVKAVVTGQIDPVGRGYVLSASLVSATDGRVLTAVREAADNDGGLIRAIDRLSRRLRERIGESLRTIRASEPLGRVTTGSLEALRKYSEAVDAGERGDYDRAILLLGEATSLDTGFAMAYRKLAVVLFNSFGDQAQMVAAATKAFEHRDRLPELERYLAVADYYSVVDYNPANTMAAYRAALDRDSDNTIALINLALALNFQHEWHEAETLALRATRIDPSWTEFFNAMLAQVAQGHMADAQATLERFARDEPGNPYVSLTRAILSSELGDYSAAEQELRRLRDEQRTSPYWQGETSIFLASLDEHRGRIRRSEQEVRDYMAAEEQRNLPQAYLLGAIRLALLDLRYRNQPAEALRTLETALAHHPLAAMPALDRPYVQLAELYARARRPDRARQLLAEYEASVPEGVRRGEWERHLAVGTLALAEGRARDAIMAFRTFDEEVPCPACGLADLAAAFERANETDSALAAYEELASGPQLWPPPEVNRYAYALPAAYKRLGELYAARGNRAKARDYYSRFVDLWNDADPELQPIVADARGAVKRLSGEPR